MFGTQCVGGKADGQPECGHGETFGAERSAVAEGAPANAQTCLDWQMIRHLATLTEAFDFEGSMEQGGEYYYRSFGTVQTPYFEIARCRPKILHVLFP